MKAISSAQMRALDAAAIAAGISGATLMERAGAEAAREIAAFVAGLAPGHVRRLVFLAGKGNNGGDAYVAARYLHELVKLPQVIYSVVRLEELSGDALYNARQVPEDIAVHTGAELPKDAFRNGDVIVDGLLGTGIKGPLKEPYAAWIAQVNASGQPVVALDLPSGLDGDDGTVATDAIRADLTVTIALPKQGLYRGRGPELCGRLRCVEIGIPPELIEQTPAEINMTFACEVRARLGRVPADCHKNSRGRVLIAGGCAAYPGAPVLAAVAAMRMGAGYVRLVLPEGVERLASAPASLVLNRVPAADGGFGRAAVEPVKALTAQADALVLGPGMGAGAEVKDMVAALLDTALPTVIDADALNALGSLPGGYRGRSNQVLTPHPGEMARLLKARQREDLSAADRIGQASGLARDCGAVVVLKGHRTVIAGPDGRVTINSSGTPGLAKAGSGDCLSGMIGTLLAQGMEAFDAAETAVFIHGYAAELSPGGIRGTIADELPQLAAAALRELTPWA